MNPLLLILVLAVLAVVWHVWGMFSSRVEQMRYTVLQMRQGFELRQYPARIVAQAKVSGPYREALNEGFRIVAGYIFGGNVAHESIAMTAPVVATQKGEQMAMTAPVLATKRGTMHTIAFGMPASYTLDTLPKPSDTRVELVELPPQKIAVLRFSGYATTKRVVYMEEKLKTLVEAQHLKVVGDVSYAGYNAPGTPPWLTRNEVLVPVE